MSAELVSVLVAVAVLWIVAAIQGIHHAFFLGVDSAVGNRARPTPVDGVEGRLHRTVRNHTEGLAMFAPLALIAGLGGFSTPGTQWGCAMVALGRILHGALYVAGVQWLRSLVFVVLIDLGMLLLGGSLVMRAFQGP